MDSTQNNPRPRKYPEPAAKPNTASERSMPHNPTASEVALATKYGFWITRTWQQKILTRRIHEIYHPATRTRWEAMIFADGRAIIGDGFGGEIGPSFETGLADLARSLDDAATRKIMGIADPTL